MKMTHNGSVKYNIVMEVCFEEESHRYWSADPSCPIKWTGVTSFLKQFEQGFNETQVAKNCTKKPSSKWYCIPVDDILKIWKDERDRSTADGHIYHSEREAFYLSHDTMMVDGIELKVYKPTIVDGVKYSHDQTIFEGIYPEFFTYSKYYEICGQSDRVEVYNGKVHIIDYKTNKEIETESFVNMSGERKMMKFPIQHIMDSNFWHYALQLNIYMFIILQNNPHLSFGSITIDHVKFEIAGHNKFGYPINRFDENGNPIVKEVIPYAVPVLQREVRNMLEFHKKLKASPLCQ